jgi:ubiquinone/menaquinone biosynthesis C-methylase UbiE
VPTREVAAQFDQISLAYDDTREPLAPTTVDRLAEVLRSGGVTSILEVGVGTGRVARPLIERGFDLTGLDPSPGMLAKARAKGLPRLVRGSGYRLPFASGSVDGALFVHVLHLLDTPRAAIAESNRVARRGTFALVRPRSAPAPARAEAFSARRTVYRILAEQGYPMPAEQRGGPPARERRLLEELPPDDLVVLVDEPVTESASRSLEMIARRASRHTLNIPAEALARAVEAARAEIGDRTVTYQRVEALATWRPVAPSAAVA